MQMSVQPILYFKDYLKISTSSSITTLKQKQFGNKRQQCSLQVLSSPRRQRNHSLYMNLSGFKMLPKENINEYYPLRNKVLKETITTTYVNIIKQHEKHAAQDRLIIERITPATNDQLEFVLTVQPHAQSSHVQSHQYPSSSTNHQSLQFPETSQIDSGYTQTDEILDNLTKQMALLTQIIQSYTSSAEQSTVNLLYTRNQQPIQGWSGCSFRMFQERLIRIKVKENCPNRQTGATFCDEEELLFMASEQGNTFDVDLDNQPVPRRLALNETTILPGDEWTF
ncbi:hypothetical protein Tco_1369819 [Tanacetum coccineum]